MTLKKTTIFLICIIMVFTTGCWDKIEIDQRAFVLAIAVDKPEKSDNLESSIVEGMGKSIDDKDMIKAIFYMPIPSKLQSGSVDTFSIEESDGINMTMALENLSMKFSRRMFLGQVKVILVGEEALKTPTIIKKLMDFIEREPDMGREASIAVVKGKTSELASVKPKFEKVFAAYMQGVFNNASSMFAPLNLSINNFLGNIRANKGNIVVPVATVEKDKVAIDQLALIKDYKFSNYVDAKYLRPYSIITGGLKDGDVIIPYKQDNISLKITSCYTNTRLKEEDNKLNYNVNVRIEGDIDNYIFNEDILNDKDVNNIKTKFETTIKDELNKVTDYFQNDIGIDYLKFGDYAKKHNYRIYEKYEKNWDQAFKKAKINYDVQIFIRRMGGTRR